MSIPCNGMIQRSGRGLDSPESYPSASLEAVVDAGSLNWVFAEHDEKGTLKFPSKDAIDDEIHRGVDRHQEVGNSHEGWEEYIEVFDDVDEESKNVADEENNHHTQKHHGQAEFTLLLSAESLSLPVGAANRFPDEDVEDHQHQKWNEIHDQEVQPDVVDLVVKLVDSQLGCHHLVDSPVHVWCKVLGMFHFPESGDVVNDSHQSDKEIKRPRSSVGAQRFRFQGMANGDVSFHRHCYGCPD
ncbi:hypothetical protein TNCV_4170371 [Trichonephila clavipes]|nr:hypothetical protein TNCV_4170371 [Trichonephila clavipes]